jgi:hypothetical protein
MLRTEVGERADDVLAQAQIAERHVLDLAGLDGLGLQSLVDDIDLRLTCGRADRCVPVGAVRRVGATRAPFLTRAVVATGTVVVRTNRAVTAIATRTVIERTNRTITTVTTRTVIERTNRAITTVTTRTVIERTSRTIKGARATVRRRGAAVIAPVGRTRVAERATVVAVHTIQSRRPDVARTTVSGIPTGTVIVRTGRTVITTRTIIERTRRTVITTRTIIERTSRTVITRVGANTAGLVTADLLLGAPTALGRGVRRLGAVAAVSRALAPGLSGGGFTGTTLAVLIAGLGAVARLEVLRGPSAGGLLVLGHG